MRRRAALFAQQYGDPDLQGAGKRVKSGQAYLLDPALYLPYVTGMKAAAVAQLFLGPAESGPRGPDGPPYRSVYLVIHIKGTIFCILARSFSSIQRVFLHKPYRLDKYTGLPLSYRLGCHGGEMTPEKPLSILVVDEKKIWLNLLAAVFSRAGWRTRSAHSCFEALRELRTLPADCLVAEYRLPDGRADGIRRAMSADPSIKPCPFIMLSADALEGPDAARECGADAFVPKGSDLKELVGMIKRLTSPR